MFDMLGRPRSPSVALARHGIGCFADAVARRDTAPARRSRAVELWRFMAASKLRSHRDRLLCRLLVGLWV